MAVLRRPAARYVVPALGIAMAVEIGVRAVRLPRLCNLLGVRFAAVGLTSPGLARPAPPSRLGPCDAARFRAACRVVGALPWARDAPCLRTALVAGRLLRHRGPALHLGATRVGGQVTAHAWIVVDDLVLDPTVSMYTNFSTPGA